MAQSDRPCGLKPVRYLNGSPWNGKVTMYYHNTSSTSAIYKGTCVAINADGADTLGHTMGCDLAGASSTILGVAVGFSNTRYLAADVTSLERNYCPASTAMYIAVVDDPNVIFEVQEDNSTSSMTNAAVGNTVKLAGHSGGSTTTGISTAEIDSSDVGNTAITSHPLLVIGLADRPDNAIGSYAKWEVVIQDHQWKTGPAGV